MEKPDGKTIASSIIRPKLIFQRFTMINIRFKSSLSGIANNFRIIDRYIIRKFLGTFFYAIILLAVVIIIFDISEKIDDFIQKQAPLKAVVFDYYFNFLPFFINKFTALFTFIAVIFFTSKMAVNTEIIAILNSGVGLMKREQALT